MKFSQYIEFFAGKGDYAGEHHFVGLCLLPLMMKQIKEEDFKHFNYINPDGSKSNSSNFKCKTLCDITYAGQGLEVKYAKNGSIRFTSAQLRTQKTMNDLWGIVAIINMDKKSSCRVVHMQKSDFYKVYGPQIKEGFNHTIRADNLDLWKPFNEEMLCKIFNLNNLIKKAS